MNARTCPADNHLSSHLLGQLTGERAEALDVHLQSCTLCCERAERLSPDDDLTSALRMKSVELGGDSGVLASIMERARALQSTNETTKARDTSCAESEERDSSIDISFLSPPQQPDEIGRIGEYRVLEVLGAGGMGVVFRAEDSKLQRQVALKAMKAEIATSQSARQRFLREARATAAIEHDNIVTIHQVGEASGIPFLAMRFLRGESLQTRLTREGRLSISEILRVGKEISSGLSAAHERGLIHRDIKPDNIWMEQAEGTAQSSEIPTDRSGSDPSSRIKIVDFGLARANDDVELTTAGTVMGTPRYMSPEQAQGQAVDHRSDLFSLGAVLYHLTTSKGPFDRDSLTATLVAVVNERPTPIADHREGVPKPVAELIESLLAKLPEERPQSANEVVDVITTIENSLHGGTTKLLTQPQSPPRKSSQRLPSAIGLAIILPLLIVFGIAFFLRTPNGTLRVEVNDDRLQVLVDGDVIKLHDQAWEGDRKARRHGLTLKLNGGEVPFDRDSEFFVVDGRRISVQIDDHELRGDQFQVSRTGKTVLRIGFVSDGQSPAQLRRSTDADDDSQPPTSNATRLRSRDSSDRDVAQQLIDLGCSVQLVGTRYLYRLPQGKVRVTGVACYEKSSFQNEHVALLAQLPELENLYFYACAVTDEGYVELAKVKSLKFVQFKYASLGDKGLAALTKLPHLDQIALLHTDVTDDGLESLTQMPVLTRLSLTASYKRKYSVRYGTVLTTDDGLVHLAGIKGLTSVWIVGPHWTDRGVENLRGLSKLPDLQQLKLGSPLITDAAIPHIGTLKSLQRLTLGAPKVTDEGMAKLRRLLALSCRITDQRGEKEDDGSSLGDGAPDDPADTTD